jgi:hypothetical protein
MRKVYPEGYTLFVLPFFAGYIAGKIEMEMDKITNKQYRTPPGELKRKKHVGMNLTEPEYALMQKQAQEAGLSFSTYIRRVSLGGPVVARLSEADRDLYFRLVQLSNDMHQLAVLAREQGVEQALAGFEAGRVALDGVLNRLKLC